MSIPPLPTPAPAPRPGDEIGPYRIEGVIGAGAMGTVYGARDLRLDRPVALKVMLAAEAGAEAFTARFHRETAVLARLDSPHVIAIFDHGEHHGLPYLVTRYAAGGDLGSLLARRGPMPPALAASVCSQVADALVAAHGVGIVHRDVKPANVLLRDASAERLHVYLADFGVALTESSGLTTPGAVAGTWNYLAPERVHGDPGSPSSDLYAVGCLFVELLTGRPPYVGTDVAVALEHVSSPVPQLPGSDETTARINRVLGLTMAKLPEHRFGDAAILRDELRELADGLTGGFRAPFVPTGGAGGGAGAGRRRSRLLLASAAALIVVAGGGTALALALTGGDSSGTSDTASAGTDGGEGGDAGIGASGTDTGSEVEDAPTPGDVDGDGLGDLVYATFDSTFVEPSTGEGFSEPERQRGPGGTLVTGDFLGSGQTQLLRIDDTSGSIGLSILAPGRRTTSTIAAPRNSTDLDLDFLAADVDGDGLDDLVVSTPTDAGTRLDVALSAGDGTFGASSRWFDGDLDAADAGLTAADFDGDGDDDVVHFHATGEYGDTAEVVLLNSTGSTFEPTGTPLEVPDEVGDRSYRFEVIQAADVDGDQVPELVCYSPYGMDAVVFDYDGSGFVDQQLWTPPEPRQAAVGSIYGVLTDVDGDGRADVVTTGIDGVRVHLSTGSAFDYAPAWRSGEELAQGFEMVGPVSLGIY